MKQDRYENNGVFLTKNYRLLIEDLNKIPNIEAIPVERWEEETDRYHELVEVWLAPEGSGMEYSLFNVYDYEMDITVDPDTIPSAYKSFYEEALRLCQLYSQPKKKEYMLLEELYNHYDLVKIKKEALSIRQTFVSDPHHLTVGQVIDEEYVAIRDGEVVASSGSSVGLLKALKEKYNIVDLKIEEE